MPQPSFGPYQLVRELGRGGMGVVHEVRHPHTPSRRLALKILHTHLLAPSSHLRHQRLERFTREAQLLAHIRHPNVVQVHDLDLHHQPPYLVLELVDGTSLDALLREGPLPLHRAVALLVQLAEGVQALHDAGIVHRDLKPDNVMVRPDGSPVLLDFGLAREVDGQSLTQTGAVLGTPQFMSPEQARGDEQRKLPAVDVYGLGAVLYACLSGRPPFDGPTLPALLHDLSDSDPEPLAGVPRPVARVCLRALHKNPAARPASPRHFAQALAQAQHARPSRRLARVLLPLAVVAGVLAALPGSEPPLPAAPTPPAAQLEAPPALDDAAFVALPLDDPRRWTHYQSIRATLDAPEHHDLRVHLTQAPLLRLPEPSPPGLPHVAAPCLARWLDDDRCLTFAAISVPQPRMYLLDLRDPSTPAHTFRPGGYALIPQRTLHDVRVSPDRTHFAYATAQGEVYWVDTDTLAPHPDGRSLPPRNPADDPAAWTSPPGARPFSQRGYLSLALTDTGRFALGGDLDTIWWGDLSTGDATALAEQPQATQCLAFLPNGHLLAAMGSAGDAYESQGVLRVFDLDGASRVIGHSEYMGSVTVLREPLGLLAGTGIGFVQRYDSDLSRTTYLAHERFPLQRKAHDTGVHVLANHTHRAFSAGAPEPHTRADTDLRVHVWDLRTNSLLCVLPTPSPAYSLDVSPHGDLLLVGLFDGHIEVWHVP